MKLHVNGLRNLIETEARSVGRKIYSTLFSQPDSFNPLFSPSENTELLTPDVDEEGYWAGGPSPFYDEDTDEVYVYYRLRDPYRRGWKAVIAKVKDGEELEEVASFYSEEFLAHSLEGGALNREDGEYVLYISYHERGSGLWKIDKITANEIESLKSENSEELDISSEKAHMKDPFIHNGELIVHTASKNFFSHSNVRVKERGNNLVTEDIKFKRGKAGGRVTSILEKDEEEFYFYDWIPSIIFTGEEKSRIGRMTEDGIEALNHDSTMSSEHGTQSLRYVKPVEVDEEIWFFYEKSMPGKGHALALDKMEKEKALALLGKIR